jgi:deoxyribodipyrimidine photolyase-related protein
LKDARKVRNLVLVFGDQLDLRSAAFDGLDRDRDLVVQLEVLETSYILQHKMRLAYFFSSMRHFRDELRAAGMRTEYVEIDDPDNRGSFEGELARLMDATGAERVVTVEPGDWRVASKLNKLPFACEVRADRHFLCSKQDFASFCENRPRPIMENFYRYMRRETGILMDWNGRPVGGDWNFDAQNRRSFGKKRPVISPRSSFEPDEITEDVLSLVAKRFPESPGKLDGFDLPVSRAHALASLRDFVSDRLPRFGDYQDAMLGGQATLFHSHLSGPLNLHLIDPREVIEAALDNPAKAPLNAVEGFVRQILGWREFVRGIYWHRMPQYADENALEAHLPMPAFYWTGHTDMRCLAEAIGHTIDLAYAHHIERLMVLGLFAMLLGVRPYDVHRWHMSMFWDAIDWVSLPNTLGMSQHGDGGIVGTKPYAASGAYIDRMSDHCKSCRYDPKKATGDDACPFTTLYWTFLDRHRDRFRANGRMRQQYFNLDRKGPDDIKAIRRHADRLTAALATR